mmetsp:Transcript_31972/g.50986  ORF Transcript_31972/g.50986 Transcript_31972/m.50986 type:complete len:447 (-) Transcript_31972:192-1532(-)
MSTSFFIKLLWTSLVAGFPLGNGSWTLYSCVIDAGSTGNRLHLYKASGGSGQRLLEESQSFKSSALIEIIGNTPWHFEAIHETKNELALAKHGARVALGPLLETGKQWLKDLDLNVTNIPLYLGATAGVRVLPFGTLKSIMQGVHEEFSASGFAYRKNFARVLSGEEEAAFGWGAVQYLTNYTKQSVGVLDLGGGSTQITTQESYTLSAEFELHSSADYKDRLFARSHLYFGGNGFKKQVQEFLAISLLNENQTNGSNPCLVRGYQEKVELSGILYTFTGTSNPVQCDQLTAETLKLHLSSTCMQGSRAQNECSIHGSYIPPDIKYRTFIAMNNFFHIWNFFDISGSRIVDLMSVTQGICSMGLVQFEDYAKARKIPMKFAWDKCLDAYYVKHLLIDAYHFDPVATQIMPVNKLSGHSVTWALGLAIYENYQRRVESLFSRLKQLD